MSNKKIRVHTAFNFNEPDGSSQRFEVGEHVVDAQTADHWFVVAHSDVSGSVSNDADLKSIQSQIESLTAQLGDKDSTIATLQSEVADKDAQIESLTAQLAALNQPGPAGEGTSDGKKQKSTDGK